MDSIFLVTFNLYNDIQVMEKNTTLWFHPHLESNIRNATQGHKMPSKPNDNMKDKARGSQCAGAGYLQVALKSTMERTFHYYLESKMSPWLIFSEIKCLERPFVKNKNLESAYSLAIKMFHLIQMRAGFLYTKSF